MFSYERQFLGVRNYGEAGEAELLDKQVGMP